MGKDYDPAMHSAEHLLNQTMVRMFGCGRSVNAHIEKRKSRIDYRFPRNLTTGEISAIESQMNVLIGADLPVREDFMNRSEAAARFNLSKLPEEAGERLRIILIGDYDACPCIGTHVASTGAIGRFRILSTSHEAEILRIRFKLERQSG